MQYHIIINREILIKPLQYLTNIINNRTTTNIIQNIILCIQDNGIMLLKSSNLEVEIEITILLQNCNYKKYIIAIPGKKFYNICRSLPNKTNINMLFNEDKQVQISTTTCNFIISTISADNFPYITPWASKINFVIKHIILKQLIQCTLFSTALNDIRQYLNGILLHIEKNILNIVSTDGYRLSLYSINMNKFFESYKVIIPRKSMVELLRILNNTDQNIYININTNNISFTDQNIKFTSKLINSIYPDYTQLIPIKFLKTIIINKLNFQNALTRISILADEHIKGVTLNIRNKKLKLITKNINNEIAEETLNIEEEKYPEYNINISVNINYVLDVITVLDSNNIKISFINAHSSIKIEDNNTNKIYLIMPMQI
ncbi:DNA polymerase III subunit beta [Enterobacteriaceae endosymbiont of Macroplea mutica]|uniref:DNA polymerase III subunit beta n=1 Tax=Enterobacteriaceae endosymbiont of Macroplea mutica TaxID=2675791 RepID=UPI00144A018C|nr:DNA polymerase III subunit beta [Enterobacteriaceae endosymbiont of Macroplea mutica]QJC31431.1 DNA polymerase III subunit beta [Enterobacteriaceae endosymbiont of Macroplea mutica]